jgi:hypothetical protein
MSIVAVVVPLLPVRHEGVAQDRVGQVREGQVRVVQVTERQVGKGLLPLIRAVAATGATPEAAAVLVLAIPLPVMPVARGAPPTHTCGCGGTSQNSSHRSIGMG